MTEEHLQEQEEMEELQRRAGIITEGKVRINRVDLVQMINYLHVAAREACSKRGATNTQRVLSALKELATTGRLEGFE